MKNLILSSLTAGTFMLGNGLFAASTPTLTTPGTTDKTVTTTNTTTPGSTAPSQTYGGRGTNSTGNTSTTTTTSTTTSGPTDQKSSMTDKNVKWQTYTFSDNNFSISLPVKAEEQHQQLDLPNSQTKIPYDTYVSEPNQNVSYLVGVAKYPKEVNVSSPQNNLQAAVNGTVSATPGAKLISSQMTDLGGNKAVDFVIQGQDFNMKGRYILVGSTLYQLMVAYENNQNIDDDYNTFIKSFKITQ